MCVYLGIFLPVKIFLTVSFLIPEIFLKLLNAFEYGLCFNDVAKLTAAQWLSFKCDTQNTSVKFAHILLFC